MEFECGCDAEYNDEGSTSDYFNACNVVLNHEWIKYNSTEWQTFCDFSNLPLYPDEDVLINEARYYLRSIEDPDDYEIDYPNFVDYDEKTMRNPNYAN